MDKPVISVVMPMFNAAPHLRESVASVLAQSFRDFELLVIDDGSSDESLEILDGFSDPRIRVFRNDSNLGLVASLNRGLSETRGEWVARQDADDLSHPMRFAKQLEFVRGNPSVFVTGSDAALIDESGGACGRWRTGGHADLVAWDLCFRTPFCHSTAFFRRQAAQKLGGYRELAACEDYELWSRFASDGVVVTLREPLVKYRQHARSIMAGAKSAADAHAAMRECLVSTIRRRCPGLDEAVIAEVVRPWSGEPDPDWERYFEAVSELRRAFLRGRRSPPGFDAVFADQNYMLWNRASSPADFLAALLKAMPAAGVRMPWVRMLGAKVLR